MLRSSKLEQFIELNSSISHTMNNTHWVYMVDCWAHNNYLKYSIVNQNSVRKGRPMYVPINTLCSTLIEPSDSLWSRFNFSNGTFEKKINLKTD